MMLNLKKKRLIRNISAYGGFTLCLVGDSAIGWQLWWGNNWWLLLLHVPLVLLGVGGISLYQQPSGLVSESTRQIERNLWTLSNKGMQNISGWSIMALLFGMYAFPGFGFLAYSVALIIINVLPKRMPVESRDITASWPAIVAVPKPEVQPLVESVYDTNLDTRRAAVTALGQQASPPAVQLLRQLLSDPQPEIRSDASIALNNLDDTFAHKVEDALAEWHTASAEREPTLFLAKQYYQYATSNLLDEISQHIYLVKARDILLPITEQNSADAEVWFQLARIHQRLGAYKKALQAIDTVLQLQPDFPEAFLLALELAFRMHAWDTLLAIAQDKRHVPSAALTSLRWLYVLAEQARISAVSQKDTLRLQAIRQREVHHG